MIFVDWPVRNSLYQEIANYYIYHTEIEKEDDIDTGLKKYVLFLKMAGMKKSLIGEISFRNTISSSTIAKHSMAGLIESAVFLWDKIQVTKVHLEYIAKMRDMSLRAKVVLTSDFVEKYLFPNKFHFSSKLLYSSDDFNQPSVLLCNLLIHKNEYDIMFAHFMYYRYVNQTGDFVMYKGDKLIAQVEFEKVLSQEFELV